MNIPELLNNKRPVRLPPVVEREGAIVAYRKILVGLLRDIQREADRSVIPLYRDEFVIIDSQTTDQEWWFNNLITVATLASTGAIAAMTMLLRSEGMNHAQRFIRSIKRGTRIDVPPRVVEATPAYEEAMRTYVQANASLITSLSDEAVKRVERAVIDARMSPRAARPTVFALRKTIREQLNVSKKRANLIAQNELSSLNSDLTRLRQTSVGIEYYQWNTRSDERVRPLHRSLHGQIVKWDGRGPGENGAHAGKPIRCRCYPVVYIPGQIGAIERN